VKRHAELQESSRSWSQEFGISVSLWAISSDQLSSTVDFSACRSAIGRTRRTHTRKKLVGYAGAKLKVAQLSIADVSIGPSGHILELVQYVEPVYPPHPPGTAFPNSAHMAFVVADIQSEYERLRNAGVKFRSEPVAIAAGINRGGASVVLSRPGRNYPGVVTTTTEQDGSAAAIVFCAYFVSPYKSLNMSSRREFLALVGSALWTPVTPPHSPCKLLLSSNPGG